MSPGRPFLEVGTIDTGNFSPSRQTIIGIAASHGCDAVVFNDKDPGASVPCLVYTYTDK